MTVQSEVRRCGILLALVTALACSSQAGTLEKATPGTPMKHAGMMDAMHDTRRATLHGSAGPHAAGTVTLAGDTLTLAVAIGRAALDTSMTPGEEESMPHAEPSRAVFAVH